MRKKEEDEKRLRDQEDQILKAEELQAAEHQENEKIAQRLDLEQQIAEQRNREWEAVLARDHELLLMMKHDRDNEVNFEQRLWQEERIKRLELKQLKHRNLCYEVLLQIVSLAESSAIYKASTNCAISSIDWWELKNLFVKGAIQPFNWIASSSVMDVMLIEDDKIADEAAVMDYINEQGEWESPQPIGTNKELRNILATIFRTDEADSSLVPPSFLSHMQLKLTVIGIPFAGKTFVAKLLEDRYGIALIDVEKIIASAIADAQREEELAQIQQKDDQESSINNLNIKASDEITSFVPQGETASEGIQSRTVSSRLALGRQAWAAVANGLQVPDIVIVQLLLLALESLNDNVSETQSFSPKDTKKKDSPLKEPSPRLKDNSDVHPPSQTSLTPPGSHRKLAKEKALPSREGQHLKKRTTGFILDGFPSTQQQAALLQRGLSGLKLSLESKTTVYASVLAPPPDSDLIVTKLAYPLDALIVLDPLEEGDALKQAMGKYIDPKTGLSYHLEFEPPPANDRTAFVQTMAGN